MNATRERVLWRAIINALKRHGREWEREREIFLYKFKPTDGETSTTKIKRVFKEASIVE